MLILYLFIAGRLNHLFDEYTQMHLNHLGFFASENGVGYNAFAVSSTQNTVLHIELLSGKVTMIEGEQMQGCYCNELRVEHFHYRCRGSLQFN